jgi:dethiobiotin synthetase
MSVVIAGIHTNIGKTICAATICQALGYDYWKPVQAGDIEQSDSIFIKQMVSNPRCTVHKEAYVLSVAASPHYAAATDGIKISSEKIILPQSPNNIVVETAGGIMSPLADDFLNIDLIEQLNLPVVITAANYLGSINHTLLSIAALQQRNISIRGIVFSGNKVASSQNFILKYTRLPLLFCIPFLAEINAAAIDTFAKTSAIKI